MRRFALRLRTLRQEQCGAAAVEFAIIAPMFFALLLSVVDVGRYMWTLNTIQYATDEAVRAGAIQELSIAEIKNRVAEAVAPISSTAVAVTVVTSTDAVTVTANSTYQFFFPISAFLSGAPIAVRSEMPF
jgi:Flp pilus assembly protein TadG